jgi:hypothetical protein
MPKGTVPTPGANDTSQALDNLGWRRLSSGEVAELDDATRRVSRGMVAEHFPTR